MLGSASMLWRLRLAEFGLRSGYVLMVFGVRKKAVDG